MLRNGHPTVYRTFISNVIHKGLQQYVVPFPATSRVAGNFIKQRNIKADLVHVDAGHEYEDAVEDIKMWYANLRPGGIMLGDDFLINSFPGVVKAVQEFAQQQKIELHQEKNKWWVRKPLTPATL